jgi:hypothetical protein
MAAFQFYLKSGKHRKAARVQDNNYFAFGHKFPRKRRQSVVVMQQPVLFHQSSGQSLSTELKINFLMVKMELQFWAHRYILLSFSSSLVSSIRHCPSRSLPSTSTSTKNYFFDKVKFKLSQSF